MDSIFSDKVRKIVFTILLVIGIAMAIWLTHYVAEGRLSSGSRGFQYMVIAAIISSVLTSLLAGYLEIMVFLGETFRNKNKELWGIRDPNACWISVSSLKYLAFIADKDKNNPGHEDKPAELRDGIGLGQIYALPHVISSLTAAYGEKVNWTKMRHAASPSLVGVLDDEDDLIAIGGQLTNPATKKIFHMLSKKIDITRFDNTGVSFKIFPFNIEAKYDVKGTFKRTEQDNNEEREDIGIIISYTGNRGRRFIVLAGCNTYATGGAAKFFRHDMVNTEEWRKNKENNYIAVVGCRYDGDSPYACELEMKGFHLF